MKTQEIMSRNVDLTDPASSLAGAAKKMKQDKVGALPVGENDRLVGMLTDRDIVLNAVAAGKDPNSTPVKDAMNDGVLYVFEDQEIDETAKSMAQNKVRRMPVLNRDKRLVGMVSLGDIASRGNAQVAADALKQIASAA